MSRDSMAKESGCSSSTDCRHEDGNRTRQEKDYTSRGTKVKDILWDLGVRGEQLLPGIPNDVTLGQISPKLPWRSFHILSSVSRGWRRVIQSRLVYEARVCAQSTETLIVLNHDPSGDQIGIIELSLYSVIDDSWFKLPPIPHLLKGLPPLCQCISCDGKIYVLGGLGKPGQDSKKVYVLDLASGQREWTQCARMLQPRKSFACGVMDRKIYVFGGINCGNTVCGSEVYDPKTNSWSRIRPMGFMRFGHGVVASGEELFVFGGICFNTDYFEKKANGGYNGKVYPRGRMYHPSFLGVYHSARDEWRTVDQCRRHLAGTVFFAKGRFYSMTPHGSIYVHVEKGSWLHLHSVSPAAAGATISARFELGCPPLAVNDELLTICSPDGASFRLFKCKGLGGEKKEMAWDKANDSLRFDRVQPFVCPIQL